MELPEKDFTHLDQQTGNPTMVDVGAKTTTKRSATATCEVVLGHDIMRRLLEEKDIVTKKGPVFQTAIIAGTMGAKKTSDLIPLCHPLALEKIRIEIDPISETSIQIRCTAALTGKTGVEMEAMTGASVAALTIYDMCKGFSHDILIRELKLMEKTGGKSDFRRSE
ncbi:MAG: cyclic pyranopterin monophosphate synthase MoaC [Lunatimonas sp.]|uniref:cyclic pyranopterin monophosphate synthase MoaC n=1 Tax=Lunatimonas sp. TaxID=2060141 RepID=UPI00263AA6FB|nr:cyclic pyranopterin monophosphate synthase MoaC [Lunatimonas sp.]MCC5937165.1 cyclic pyranopterin monophosphate synthase MoaC [Lunatimonas sp.]